MIALNILLGVVAGFLLLFVLAEQDKTRHTNATIAFVAVLAFIVALNTIM